MNSLLNMHGLQASLFQSIAPGRRHLRLGATTFPTVSGFRTLSWDVVRSSTEWPFTSGTTATVPAGMNLVIITAHVWPDVTGSPWDSEMNTLINGTSINKRNTDNQFRLDQYSRSIVPVTPGDTIALQIWTSGSVAPATTLENTFLDMQGYFV